MPVEIRIPSDFAEQLMTQMQPRIDAALSVVEDVQKIVAHYAIVENQDVAGNQMKLKKPRPKGNPRNFPTIPLVDGDPPDLMSPERWSTAQLSNVEAVAIFDPPEHLQYLIDKDPANGGRKFITPEQVNPSARKKIEEEILDRVENA